MEYRKLGKTDIKVSRIAFGCYPMGGWDWGKVNDRNSIDSVRKALELGVNLFDTADVYGLGHSEKILSAALGKERKKVIIATKGGLRWNKTTKSSFRDLSPKHIKKAVEESLRRLKIECIPLYQLHYPDSRVPPLRIMKTLEELIKEGKIRHLGVSNMPQKLIGELQKHGRIESLQLPYNIINRKYEECLEEAYQEWSMAVFSYGSLAQGLLSGKFGRNTKFGQDDHRSKDRNFKGKKFIANLAIIDKIKQLGIKYNKSCAQISINWILNKPNITSAIAGIKTPQQVQDNVQAVGWRLSPEDCRLIDGLIHGKAK